MKRLAARGLLAATVVVAACSYLGKQAFEQPVVHVQKVEVAGIGLTGGSLNVDLSVYNPNHYRLDASRLRYEVLLNSDSVTLARGKSVRTLAAKEVHLDDLRGPTGGFRAPMLRVGRRLLVGWHEESLRDLLARSSR